jgi:hypothetical protein
MKLWNRSCFFGLVVVGLLGASLVSRGEETKKLEGFIKARNGDTMIVHTSEVSDVVVRLTDETHVGQVQGVLKARRKEMSMAALIPGLAVKVEGSYTDQHEMVAQSISFKGNDLQRAEAIRA